MPRLGLCVRVFGSNTQWHSRICLISVGGVCLVLMIIVQVGFVNIDVQIGFVNIE